MPLPPITGSGILDRDAELASEASGPRSTIGTAGITGADLRTFQILDQVRNGQQAALLFVTFGE